MRDYAQVKAGGHITADVADKALVMLDVDGLGLDLMDRKLLGAVLEKFGGGPVGLDNIAAAIGEAPDTIEDVLEPYLIQQGYLQRTRADASPPRHLVALRSYPPRGWAAWICSATAEQPMSLLLPTFTVIGVARVAIAAGAASRRPYRRLRPRATARRPPRQTPL